MDEEDVRGRDRRGEREAGAFSAGGAAGRRRAEVSRRAAVGGLPRPATGVRPRSRRLKEPASRKRPARAQDGSHEVGHGLGRRGARHPDLRQGRAKLLEADELFFEDDDRTVANEPPPDILEQARPPDSGRRPGRPITLDAGARDLEEISGAEIDSTPPPANARRCPRGARRRWWARCHRASALDRELGEGRRPERGCRRRRPTARRRASRRAARRAPLAGRQPRRRRRGRRRCATRRWRSRDLR